MDINVRLTVPDNIGQEQGIDLLGVEAIVIHTIVADVDLVDSAVVLRNNGFGHLLPDESTRQER